MPLLSPEPWTLGAKVAVGALSAGAVALAFALPPVAAGLAGLYALGEATSRRRSNRIRAERSGESICTFARAFDVHTVDPWLIRAVWDEVQSYLCSGERDFPVRATDDIESDLSIDPGDIDDIAVRAAQRAGRSIEQTERNPLSGSVRTVGDLVHFLNAQPVVGAA